MLRLASRAACLTLGSGLLPSEPIWLARRLHPFQPPAAPAPAPRSRTTTGHPGRQSPICGGVHSLDNRDAIPVEYPNDAPSMSDTVEILDRVGWPSTQPMEDSPAPTRGQEDDGSYIPREISVRDADGQPTVWKEKKFLDHHGPLVVLGDPGMGKSTLVRHYAAHHADSIKVLNATEIETHLRRESAIPPGRTVVDGLDEVATDSHGELLSRILSRFSHDTSPDLVLTCRASIWREVNSRLYQNAHHKSPLVGTLLPLKDGDIEAIVKQGHPGMNGASFLEKARRQGIDDLMRNPQYLTMFLKIASTGDWPKTKAELYRLACKMLAEEHNEWHVQYPQRDKPETRKILAGAGLVFAQLLLSGKSSVAIYPGPAEIPTLEDLTDGELGKKELEFALGTKLFVQRGGPVFEPCHRTVAEYLAAIWIADMIQCGCIDTIDVEAAMRVGESFVPRELHGLHAWIATVCSQVTSRFIARDPLGYWCHGDKDKLDEQQSLSLLDQLEQMAEGNPDFYGKPRQVGIGAWPRWPAVQERIVRQVQDRTTTDEFLWLIVESIRDEAVFRRIAPTLESTALDQNAPTGNRHACLHSLVESKRDFDLDKLLVRLHATGDVESISVALRAIRTHPRRTVGTTVAKLLIAAGTQRLYLGLGQHGIQELLDIEQTTEGLGEFLKIVSSPDNRGTEEARHWITPYLEQWIVLGDEPPSKDLWPMLRHAKRAHYYERNWDQVSLAYFSSRPDVRRRVQADAIQDTETPRLLERLVTFEKISPGLALNETDLTHHMDMLLRTSPADWMSRWEVLARFGHASGFAEHFHACAGRHITQHVELGNVFSKAKGVSREETERKWREHAHKLETEKKEKFQTWRKQFEDSTAEIASGQNFSLVAQAAEVSLGFGPFGHRYPRRALELLEEHLGEEMAITAWKGMEKVVTSKSHYVSAQDMARTRASHKLYKYERILLAYCILSGERKQTLEHLPREVQKSALATCHFSRWAAEIGPLDEVTQQLEKLALLTPQDKVSYLRDITEPFLVGSDGDEVGTFQLSSNSIFSDIRTNLAKEWIHEYPGMSDGAYWTLAYILRDSPDMPETRAFFRERLQESNPENEKHHGRLMCTVFEIDFDFHHDLLKTFAKENRERLWVFCKNPDSVTPYSGQARLTAQQNRFLIEMFATEWPDMDHPGGLVGSHDPWNASMFIRGRIDALKQDLSYGATLVLHALFNSIDVNGYRTRINTAFYEQREKRGEAHSERLDIEKIRAVLLKRRPATHDHVLAMLLAMLEDIQNKITNSPTNQWKMFWEPNIQRAGEAQPRGEEHCRDRIMELLNSEIKENQRKLRMIPEARMPCNRRADLQCVSLDQTISVPIEIKCQWSRDLWVCLDSQLTDYARNHDSGHTGLLIVLWFGDLGGNHRKNPISQQPEASPRDARDLLEKLKEHRASTPYLLETFVLDLSGTRIETARASAPLSPPPRS